MQSVHTITHLEIPAPDLKKAVSFYSKLFDWQIETQPQGDCAFFRIGSTQSGGSFSRLIVSIPHLPPGQKNIVWDDNPKIV